MLKKGLSIILVMVMIVSIFTIIPFSASAKEANTGSDEGADLLEQAKMTEFEANVEFIEESTEALEETEPETIEVEETEQPILPTRRKPDLATVGETVNGFTYSVNNKEATITAYNDKSVTSLTIPEKIGGYKVTTIGSSAFSNYSNLSNVTIPDDVVTIGINAFYNTPWYNNQPDGLVYAGRVAYSYKGSMPADTVVTLRDNTASITGRAFYECTELKQINLNASLQSIGSEAFYRCASLTSVIIPGSVGVIGSSSFSGCSSLNSVTLNNGVLEIGPTAFYNCTALETISLPNSITKIGHEAFRGDVSLTGLVLPSGLTETEYDAFRGCTSLTEITIPANWKKASYPFNKCDNLKKMVFADGCTVIPGTIAEYCYGLEEVIIPDTVTEIEYNAFYECKALKSITIPDSVQKIGQAAFYYNISLETVVLSKNVTTINDEAFGYCTSLKEVFIPKSVKTTGKVFYNSGLEKAEYESGATIVSTSILNSCKSLTTVILPNSVTEIGPTAFYNCTALETISLPNSITKIGHEAFRGDVSLTGLVLPSGLTETEYDAFRGCTSLTEITIPANWKKASYPFNKCDNLKKMVFADGCTVIPGTIAEYCYGLEEVIIPNTVTEIEYNAFYECKALESVFLPNSLEKIGSAAFYGCSNLTVYCCKYSKIVIGLIDEGKDIITYNDTRTIESVAIDDTKSYYEARNTTGSSFVCNYSIKSSVYSSIRNPYIKIKIPAGAFIADQSLYRDGVICTDFTDNTSYITVPIKNREGKITFNLTFSGDCKMITYATLNYTLNSKNDYDIIDIINNDIPVIAVYSEDITSSDTVHVSGMAPVSTDVKIAVDGTNVSTVTSNKAGSFSADIKLPSLKDGKEYTIEASAEYLGDTIKNETTVTYRENAPELISFTMGYKGVTYDLLSGKSYSISFVPNSTYPFHFDVKFKNPGTVGHVYIISSRNQVQRNTEANWDNDKQSFVFDGFFDTSNYAYVPGKISLKYSFKEEAFDYDSVLPYDDLPEMFKNATITELEHTDNTFIAKIDLGEKGDWEYTYNDDASIEELRKTYLKKDSITLNDDLAPTGSWEDNIFIKFFVDVVKDVGKDCIAKSVSESATSPDGMAVLINRKEKKSIDYIAYDSVKKSIVTQSVKYGTAPIVSFFSDLDVKDSAKAVGMVYSEAKTIIKYQDQFYDVETVKNQIGNSRLSQSEKQKRWDDLDKLQWGYTGLGALKIAGSLASAVAGIALGPFGGILAGLAMSIFTGIIENNLDNAVEGYRIPSDSSMSFLVDPSGYVYACVESNRISGAKVTTYWIPYDEDDEDFWDNPDESKSQIWKADEYSQVNPLFTDDNGDYAWDVPEGWWKVVVEKEGYETYTTDWLPVPPPQTEVNVGLISNSTPSVASVQVDNNTLTMTFSEYMDPESLNNIVIKDYYNEEINYQLLYPEDDKDSNGKVFSKEYQLVLDKDYTVKYDYYVVSIEGAKNYSGIPFSGTIEFGEMPIIEEDHILGDVDGDGTVTIIDATYIQRKLASIAIPFEMNDSIADTDSDGSVTIIDATYIQRWLASLPSNDNIGKPIV